MAGVPMSRGFAVGEWASSVVGEWEVGVPCGVAVWRPGQRGSVTRLVSSLKTIMPSLRRAR